MKVPFIKSEIPNMSFKYNPKNFPVYPIQTSDSMRAFEYTKEALTFHRFVIGNDWRSISGNKYQTIKYHNKHVWSLF